MKLLSPKTIASAGLAILALLLLQNRQLSKAVPTTPSSDVPLHFDRMSKI
jgi:hypothetical protein